MTSTSPRQPAPKGDVLPRAKIWLEVRGQYVFGHGISEILKAVQRTGSIKAAAGELGKSYRHVWARIKETEEALGQPLVHTQVGGGDVHRSELSDQARDLVKHFDAMRERMLQLVQREYRQFLQPILKKRPSR